MYGKKNLTTQDVHDWDSPEYVDYWIDRMNKKPSRYDRQRVIRYQNTLREFAFHPSRPVRILELGIGWGDLTKYIFDFFPEVEIVGLDGSSRMLEMAQKNLSPWADRVSLHLANLSDSAALDGLGMFDGILSTSTLQNLSIPDLDGLLGQVTDHLQPDGSFINCEFFYNSKRLQSRLLWRLAAMARSSNLSNGLSRFLESSALNNEPHKPPPAIPRARPLLRDYLDLLSKNGLKYHWRRDNYQVVVVSQFVSARTHDDFQ